VYSSVTMRVTLHSRCDGPDYPSTTARYSERSPNPSPASSSQQSTGSTHTSGPSPGEVTAALLDELPELLMQSEYSLAVNDHRRFEPIAKKPGLSLMEVL